MALNFNVAQDCISIDECESYALKTNSRHEVEKKHVLYFKDHKDGHFLSVHHTIKEDQKRIRVVLCCCCFNLRGIQLVSIDCRGNIFVFDFSAKRYWRHKDSITKPSVIIPSIVKENHYLVGTKAGHLILLDAENSTLTIKVSDEAIREISFPGLPLHPKNLVLICTGNTAQLINLDTLICTYRLEFDHMLISLKFASYLPYSDQIFTCFTNDNIHIWSGISLEVKRIVQPLKLREKKLKFKQSSEFIPTLYLDTLSPDMFIACTDCPDLTEGLISSYSYQREGNLFCLTTLDNYLMFLNPHTFELLHLYKLENFTLKQCHLLPKPHDNLLLGFTLRKQVVLFDTQNAEYKLIIDLGPCRNIQISPNGKFLAIVKYSGELYVWSMHYFINMLRSQERCMDILRTAFKQTKSINNSAVDADCNLQDELNILLTPRRLLPVLQEYNCYPAKYRYLIWTCLLHLPNNRKQYQSIVNMGTPALIRNKIANFPLKNGKHKAILLKCWSNLANWCKIFAYNDAVPHLIFPFAKIFQRNPFVLFEICMTLMFNQFQLFFEYHPLEPSNYLGMCDNILQHFDANLYNFYLEQEISASVYVWSILRNGFSEILDEDQWYCLWDHVISTPSYFLMFAVIAYNIIQREVIIRLRSKTVIAQFFTEQNPIDIKELLMHSYKLMKSCPKELHPKRHLGKLQFIPKGVYPKFLKYPIKLFDKYEQEINDLKKIHKKLDQKMRESEKAENQVLACLEKGLREEEQSKRTIQLQQHYAELINKEEENIHCQQKMLLLYQKELRNRKEAVMQTIQKAFRNKQLLQKENKFHHSQNKLKKQRLYNDINFMSAEEEVRNQNLDFISLNMEEKQRTEKTFETFNSNIENLCKGYLFLNNEYEKLDSNASRNKCFSNMANKCYLNLDMIDYKVKMFELEFQQLIGNSKKTN